MPGGYPEWTQAPYGDPCILGGITYAGIPQPLEREPTVRASRVVMRSGRVVMMVPVAEDGAPLQGGGHWRWSFALQADQEELWYHLGRLWRRAEAADWVDYGYDQGQWIGVAAVASYTLPRPPADGAVAGFPAVEYPPLVKVDGVDQTVVAGTPAAGEAQVTATALVLGTVPAGGEVVELRYVPVYRVVVSAVPETLPAFGDLSGQVVLVEVQE
jgi:hypothetical protein